MDREVQEESGQYWSEVGLRVRANGGDIEHQGDEHVVSGPRGGSRPRAPRVWLRSPRFFTLPAGGADQVGAWWCRVARSVPDRLRTCLSNDLSRATGWPPSLA